MKLTDDKITLRALEPTDIDVMYRWENDAELWRYGSTVAPFSRKQIWEYIAGYDADIYSARQLRLMIVDNASGDVVGAIDITDYDPVNQRAAIGIFVDRSYQRKGFASAAIRLVEGYCAERLGMHQLWAMVPGDNTPSRSLFTSSGYKISGRLQSWLKTRTSYCDAYIYQHFI